MKVNYPLIQDPKALLPCADNLGRNDFAKESRILCGDRDGNYQLCCIWKGDRQSLITHYNVSNHKNVDFELGHS